MINDHSNEVLYGIITVTVVILLMSIFIILMVLWHQKKNQQHRMKMTELKNKNDQMKAYFEQELLQTKIEIQEQTLKTISQEIHDNVGQVLSLAKLNLNTLPVFSKEQVAKVADTRDLVGKAIIDLRNLSRSLYGDRITQIGLKQSIEDELRFLKNTGEFNTVLNVSGTFYKLEKEKETVVFRILQEALHNAAKHSKAKTITVNMIYLADRFQMNIADDGIGFNLAGIKLSETGIGLNSMKSRAALIGGNFAIESEFKKGTLISFELKNKNKLDHS